MGVGVGGGAEDKYNSVVATTFATIFRHVTNVAKCDNYTNRLSYNIQLQGWQYFNILT